MRHRSAALAAGVTLAGTLLGGCASAPATQTTSPRPASPPATAAARPDSGRPAPGTGAVSAPNADPFPSTYVAPASRATVIRDVTIMTAAGPTIRNGSVLLRDGKIAAVGATVSAPQDADVRKAWMSLRRTKPLN